MTISYLFSSTFDDLTIKSLTLALNHSIHTPLVTFSFPFQLLEVCALL